MIEYSRFWFAVLIGIGIAFLSLAILFGLKVAYSQDFDPCFVNNDMYQRICDQQKINNILQDLLERAREWNDNP